MDRNLTKLEKAILEQIASAPRNAFLRITDHLAFLSVRSRELTGVVMYVKFDDSTPIENLSEKLNVGEVISDDHIVEINTLENGLGYVLYADVGRLDFLELFTYGAEPWDGTYNSFSFLEV